MRTPPYSQDAERAVLGSALLHVDAADAMLETLKETDFYYDTHRTLFRAIRSMRFMSTPVDLVTITTFLSEKDQLAQIGGATYISTLANSVPTAANAQYYADIVLSKARLRDVIEVATKAAEAAYNGDANAVELLQSGAWNMDDNSRANVLTYKDIMSKTFDVLEKRYEAKGIITGVTTGFYDLDDATAGLQPGEMAILGARPSMGKSALARCIAENAARSGHGVLFAMLEDTPVNLGQRALSSGAHVRLKDLRRGLINDHEWDGLSLAMGRLCELPITALGPVGVTTASIKSTARKLKRDGNLGLIIVDYLQLVRPLRERDNRYLEVSEVSRQLKAIAQEMEVPMLALAQLSRAVEMRTNKRPQLSDLRESGDIEQDADLVMFLYRDAYYNEKADPTEAEILIEKQRNGPTGSVMVRFDPNFVTFQNLERRRTA